MHLTDISIYNGKDEIVMFEEYEIKIGDEVRKYKDGVTFGDIAKDYQDKYPYDIVLVTKDGKLTELFRKVTKNCKVEFITTATSPGIETYRRSVKLLLMKAFYDVAGADNIRKITVEYSISKGYYYTVDADIELTEELLEKVEERMRALADENLPINKRSVSVSSAIALFNRHKMYDKEKLFRFRRASNVNVYSIKGFEDYYYGYMVPSTGYLKYFKLYKFEEGFVLQLPVKESPDTVQEFAPQRKLFNVLRESGRWSDMLDISNVGSLNEQISQGRINDIILVQEALQEKKIAEIASNIAACRDKKFIMIAGPSSSGKTTFSHRLSVQLRVNGLTPHTIGIDDYFVDRELSPRDEFGNYNFEVLEALDVEKFNEDMQDLEKGKEVQMPTYNFITGKREYNGNKMKLGKDDILVIEGIHGLNDRLSYSLSKESKYKIYISALTTLNIDEHNRIPTTDGRLIRRLVRDARTRGISAADTISRWQSVRNGEESHIFPFQEEADIMFNSALIYELAVLKQYAEPILFGIPQDAPEYIEAKRLLKFLDYFLGIDSKNIPNNSLLREFIGGGCFNV